MTAVWKGAVSQRKSFSPFAFEGRANMIGAKYGAALRFPMKPLSRPAFCTKLLSIKVESRTENAQIARLNYHAVAEA